EQFRAVFTPERFGGRIDVDFVFQELDYLPEGFSIPPGREKPWGTNHAVMMGASVIDGPFAVINADDFYGRSSYEAVADYLARVEGQQNLYCMVGFKVKNTLSENGSVSRGVCGVDGEGNLTSMVERTSIERIDGKIYYQEDGQKVEIPEDTPVSMNIFGFLPDYFKYSEDYFRTFLAENADNLKAEFYIPTMVNKLVGEGVAKMRVLPTDSQWFGVTYKEDRPMVVERIRGLIMAGEYPEKLW
ncbi:MAG: nucleotidyltransferase, partial [Alistipes sp.]|nr:nucleotidyltransferase [Alistipes sp.]